MAHKAALCTSISVSGTSPNHQYNSSSNAVLWIETWKTTKLQEHRRNFPCFLATVLWSTNLYPPSQVQSVMEICYKIRSSEQRQPRDHRTTRIQADTRQSRAPELPAPSPWKPPPWFVDGQSLISTRSDSLVLHIHRHRQRIFYFLALFFKIFS